MKDLFHFPRLSNILAAHIVERKTFEAVHKPKFITCFYTLHRVLLFIFVYCLQYVVRTRLLDYLFLYTSNQLKTLL